jgi:hypothetical protein
MRFGIAHGQLYMKQMSVRPVVEVEQPLATRAEEVERRRHRA